DLSGTIYKLSPSQALTPVISSALGQGKNVVVTGQDFDTGARILVDGNPVKTLHDVSNVDLLVAKKLLKRMPHGGMVLLQVQNSSGAVSDGVSFTRP
ncbi:MAG TPA: IPT/TIG domain-containing protein, partial [Blastocatellia bacterium]|nr:IPT/TIG domain-containing protein [Blastocatellia bacterium]